MLRSFITYVLSKLNDKKGQGLVEYALIIALVSIAVILVLGNLGSGIGTKFQEIINKLNPPAA